MMVLLPEQRTGIVVLNNLDSRLLTVVTWELADKLLGLDLGDAIRAQQDQRRETNANGVPGTKPRQCSAGHSFR